MMTHCTIAGNVATGRRGGTFRQGAAVALNAVDFSDNTPDNCAELTR